MADVLVHVARIATEYRQRFKRDIVIDMFCYRRYGHNEGDEPGFTQPLMYKQIRSHKSTLEIDAALLGQLGLSRDALVDTFIEHDIARHVDLLVGVAPTMNLEWIQKIDRDTKLRGYSQEAVIDTILGRMHDYVRYIQPQFSRTHINFQRVPTVDTSNPFEVQDIPTDAESFVVIRFRDPSTVDFPYLLAMIQDSFMSRPHTLVVPGSRMPLAMELILAPLVRHLLAQRRFR